MREATRAQILNDMGITLWRLRGTEPAPLVGPRQPREDAPESAAADTAAAAEAPPVPTSSSQAWSVLSIALPGTVLLLDAGASRRDLRLARDLVAAASGDWRARPVRRRFDWPPRVSGAVTRADDDGRRALNAFVGKDLDDHGARLLICTGTYLALLPESLPGCRLVACPTLDVVGRDTEAKRALWAAIRDQAS